MKYLLIIGFLFFSLAMSQKAHAQFFKKLADEVSERVENKVINDAGDAAVSGVDKAEKGTANAVKGNGKKKARKKESRNSNETSQAENANPNVSAMMKRLNLGNSSRAKEPLPENYTLSFTGFGSDYYLKYRMQVNTEQSSAYTMDMTTEMYLSPDIGARSQTTMSMPMIGEITMAVLTHFDDPNHMTIINERKKSYTVMDLTEMKEKNSKLDYKVTNLGKEEVFGLNCTHARVTMDKGAKMDIWTTKEIPAFNKLMKLYFKTNKKTGGDQMWEALKEAGAVGFMVKMVMVMEKEGGSSVMQLTQMKRMTVPDAMLEVPSGYKEKSASWGKRVLNK